jgi:hypothetical protein
MTDVNQKLLDLEARLLRVERTLKPRTQSSVLVIPPLPPKTRSIYDYNQRISATVCDPDLVKRFNQFCEEQSVKSSRGVDIILYNFFRDRNHGQKPTLSFEDDTTPTPRYVLNLSEDDYHLLCRLLDIALEPMEDRAATGQSNYPHDDDVVPGRDLSDRIHGWKSSDLGKEK